MAANFPESELSTFVRGRPTPQGSKKYVGRGRMVEMSKHLAPWRQAMVTELTRKVRECVGPDPVSLPLFRGAIRIEMEFVMPRPVSMSKRRRTPRATKRPDLDKLCRAAFDAAQIAGMFPDDSNVVELYARKRTAEPDEDSGVLITITELGET